MTLTGNGTLDTNRQFLTLSGSIGGRRLPPDPAARLYWTQGLADVTTAGFAAAPAAQRRSVSAKGGRDGAIAGIGISLQVPGNIVVYANCNAHIRDNPTAQAITGGLHFAR